MGLKTRTRLARDAVRFGCLVRVLSDMGIDSTQGPFLKHTCREVVERMKSVGFGHDVNYLRVFIRKHRLLLAYLVTELGTSSATHVEVGEYGIQLKNAWMERKLSCKSITDWPIENQQEFLEMCKACNVNVEKMFGEIMKENIHRVQAVQESNAGRAPKIENKPSKEEQY